MVKRSLDKPIIFDSPEKIPVARRMQDKTWRMVGGDIKAFVHKTVCDAVGYWMRQEMNAPLLNRDFGRSGDGATGADLPYNTELGKLHDIFIKITDDETGHAKKPCWQFDRVDYELLKNAKDTDVLALASIKHPGTVDGNVVFLSGLIGWRYMRDLVVDPLLDNRQKCIDLAIIRSRLL